MTERVNVDAYQESGELFHRMEHGGVLCTVADRAGRTNLLTLGWGLLGRRHGDYPILAIAITPLRYSFRLIEEVPEFVIAVPDDSLADAVSLCGTRSGRDMDKWAAAGLTPVAALHVQPPAVRQCPLNLECRVYTRVTPPHMLLMPRHRRMPLEEQHTIYFAEVLAAYRWG
jgi:flavin reductase (DIM6/NTAB) family NADH-FMN oxidoreductase RutF